ncbi:MBL fold metallo-hydrolase [Chitinophaga vietnamensis]|uniref:MBL fold metallo-hydrolase n=1 Tax=Chitinophaga vietnamensis TaxID=2593957 RepID=UPI0011785104|nr:MBL fold metallo-hydrolase [Chitinophaga vietnamensis]
MYTSPHFNGKVFENPVPTQVSVPGKLWGTMWKFFTYKGQRVPDHPLGPFQLSPAAYETAPTDALRVAWLGHSSYLLQAGGKRFILDPVWAKRASPVAFMGPERFFDVPVAPEQLPALDGIILTHDHYDHLDEHMIRFLIQKKIPFYCPLGVDALLLKWGADKALIQVFDWWQEKEIMSGIKLTATPARHFSGRGFQRNRTLWTSYVLETGGRKVFIGGDSGYFPGFAEIGKKFGPFDLTILEIGAYGDTWPDIHMGPANAAKAHLELGGKVMLPVHWGTFNLALHPWDEPAERIVQIAKEKGITLWMPAPGACSGVPTHTSIDPWWRK